MRIYNSKYTKRLHIFNYVFVYFRNIDNKLIIHVIKNPEAKILFHVFF